MGGPNIGGLSEFEKFISMGYKKGEDEFESKLKSKNKGLFSGRNQDEDSFLDNDDSSFLKSHSLIK